MHCRVHRWAVVVLLGGCFAPGSARAVTGGLPIKPGALVVARRALPGFAKARTQLQSAGSPADWTKRILEDTPSNAFEEEGRLREEGFRQGVLETLKVDSGAGFSGALVLGTPAAASRESSVKASEELAELGVGATRFRLAQLPGAIGLQQAHPARSPLRGHYTASVVLSVGVCSAGVGAALKSLSAARHAAITGAITLRRQLRRVCS